MMSMLFIPQFCKMTTAKVIGLEEYATGLIKTHTTYHRQSVEHVGTAGNQHSRNLVDFRVQISDEWRKLDMKNVQRVADSLPNGI